jgi:calcium/calmodulin-dependent protein kinase I
LADYITRGYTFSENQIKTLSIQLLLSINYMNLLGIIHRDLKPENILMNSRDENNLEIRIADFGLAIVKKPEISQLKSVALEKNGH